MFLALIFPVRGMLNVLNRTDYIIQRLDDYPRIYENFRLEAEGWWNWKQTDDYAKRAEQAALIYVSDEKHESEKAKLSYITNILDVERAAVISSGDYEKYSEKNRNKALSTYYSELPDGRLMVISLRGLPPEADKSLTDHGDSWVQPLEDQTVYTGSRSFPGTKNRFEKRALNPVFRFCHDDFERIDNPGPQ